MKRIMALLLAAAAFLAAAGSVLADTVKMR